MCTRTFLKVYECPNSRESMLSSHNTRVHVPVSSAIVTSCFVLPAPTLCASSTAITLTLTCVHQIHPVLTQSLIEYQHCVGQQYHTVSWTSTTTSNAFVYVLNWILQFFCGWKCPGFSDRSQQFCFINQFGSEPLLYHLWERCDQPYDSSVFCRLCCAARSLRTFHYFSLLAREMIFNARWIVELNRHCAGTGT